MKVVMIGPFGMTTKSTMRERALPMAKALVRRGHRLTILVPPWDSPDKAGQTWLDEGVRVINSLLPRTKGPLFHPQLVARLVWQALKLQPDVVHFFKPKAYAGLSHLLLLALRLLRQHQARLIVDEDDWEAAWNEINDYTTAQKYFFAWQEPWGLKRADGVTVASRELQHLVAGLNVPRHKIYYVPNGSRPIQGPLNISRRFPAWRAQLSRVMSYGAATPPAGPAVLDGLYSSFDHDFSGRVRAEYDLFGQPIILLYTRFFEFQLASLLTVIGKVNQYLPETRWLIVGRGYFEEEKKLAQMARERNLGGKLIFAGWVAPERLPHYFAAANVALHPYDDNLLNRTKCSVKLLDLLSAGVPVVASRVGQNMEYIIHGKTGLLVPPRDLDAMAEALLFVLNRRDLQQRLGQEAARYVNHAFGWDALVEVVEAAYEERKGF